MNRWSLLIFCFLFKQTVFRDGLLRVDNKFRSCMLGGQTPSIYPLIAFIHKHENKIKLANCSFQWVLKKTSFINNDIMITVNYKGILYKCNIGVLYLNEFAGTLLYQIWLFSVAPLPSQNLGKFSCETAIFNTRYQPPYCLYCNRRRLQGWSVPFHPYTSRNGQENSKREPPLGIYLVLTYSRDSIFCFY